MKHFISKINVLIYLVTSFTSSFTQFVGVCFSVVEQNNTLQVKVQDLSLHSTLNDAQWICIH